MEDFPSNSHTDKEKPPPKKMADTKKVERITTGEAKIRKKPLGKRFKQMFFGGDARSAFASATTDVLLPAAKDMVFDYGREALERLIFGESRSRPRGGWRSANSPAYTAYNRVVSKDPPWQRQDPRREVSHRARSRHEFDEIVLDSRGEAEEVIDQLMEIIREYGQASVADLYAMVGISTAYTDQKYGWTELRGASVSHIRGGQYLLNIPKPIPLD